mmetsp:Transcript_108651/g.316038  ORF Transcript_108651/g.316038 Transcript_108651/m.316038 type:complete len:759 (+) Transcript_108651:278-2554(+)
MAAVSPEVAVGDGGGIESPPPKAAANPGLGARKMSLHRLTLVTSPNVVSEDKMSLARKKLVHQAEEGPSSLAEKVQAMKNSHNNPAGNSPLPRSGSFRGSESPTPEASGNEEEALVLHGPAPSTVWASASKHTLHPEGKFYFRWNVGLTLALLYVSIAVPLQMGFRLEADPWSGWKYFEMCVDTFFIFDFFFNFWHGFLDHDGILVMTQPACAQNYMSSGWIWIDGFTSVPYDWFSMGEGGNVAALKVLKSFKAAKILRLNRLLRGSLLDLVEDILATDASVRFAMKMTKLTLGMFFVLHLMACTWHYVTDPNADDNWVRGYLGGDDYFLDYYKISASSRDDEDWSTDTWPIAPRYLAAMYWSTMTLSTVGYGDVLPKSNSERAMAILGMVVGGGVYGIVLGNLVSIVTDVDYNARAYHDRMGAIISYMTQRGFPPGLQRKIKKFYRRYFKSKSALDEKTILAELPNTLKTESSMFLVSDLVFKLEIFSDLEQSHLPQLTELITPIFYEEGEMILIYGDDMRDIQIMSDGKAVMFDSKGVFVADVHRGSSFGSEALLAPIGGGVEHWPYSLVASTSVEVLTIPVLTLLAAFDGDAIVEKMIDRARRAQSRNVEAPPTALEGGEDGDSEGDLKITETLEAPEETKRGGDRVSAPAQPPVKIPAIGDVRLLKAKAKSKAGDKPFNIRKDAGLAPAALKSDLTNHHDQIKQVVEVNHQKVSDQHGETRRLVEELSEQLKVLKEDQDRTSTMLRAIYERSGL